MAFTDLGTSAHPPPESAILMPLLRICCIRRLHTHATLSQGLLSPNSITTAFATRLISGVDELSGGNSGLELHIHNVD